MSGREWRGAAARCVARCGGAARSRSVQMHTSFLASHGPLCARIFRINVCQQGGGGALAVGRGCRSRKGRPRGDGPRQALASSSARTLSCPPFAPPCPEVSFSAAAAAAAPYYLRVLVADGRCSPRTDNCSSECVLLGVSSVGRVERGGPRNASRASRPATGVIRLWASPLCG